MTTGFIVVHSFCTDCHQKCIILLCMDCGEHYTDDQRDYDVDSCDQHDTVCDHCIECDYQLIGTL